MKHRSKRFLSILLSLVMVLGLMPGLSLTALADSQIAYTFTATSTSDDWTTWMYYLAQYPNIDCTQITKIEILVDMENIVEGGWGQVKWHTGTVNLVLCENSTLRIRAGIYHIGSQLNIYTENGSENAAIIVNGEQVELSGLTGYSELTGVVSEEGALISGKVNVYGGRLVVNKGSNQKLVGDDISLTLGVNLWASDLTGGTENADGSTTYAKAAFANLTSLAVKPVAVVTTAPTAKTLAYNGQAQELINAGTANGGTMYYALGENATTAPADNLYSTSIPTVTDAGTYYVWYKVVGDANHYDTEAQCIEASIGKKTVMASAADVSVTYDGQPHSIMVDVTDPEGASITYRKAGEAGYGAAKTVLVDPGKKQLSDAHASEFRYASSNEEIATVDQKGKIKGVSAGTCTVYVFARNGYAKKIQVIVK